ncbi:MAG: hypothetical protein KF833_06795 [Verrucomicrobiae bacterium]|nr:hypothetical protein [Verrucomicrobiae bacterium]
MSLPLHFLVAGAALGVLLGGPASSAQTAFVRNPSFESNFPELWPYYGAVDEWPGASGVNDVVIDAGGPFHNAGTPVPDRVRVGFKQGGGDVTQEIYGLDPGSRYWLQFFYDGRRGGGAAQSMIVYFDDEEIGRDPNIRPSDTGYYFMNAPFVPENDFGTIRIHHIVSGDRTLLLDGVTVVARTAEDVVVRNPSFEASGVLPETGYLTAMAGWEIEGTAGADDGSGGIFDNGVAPDQDLVGFIEGSGSLSQTLRGLVVGTEYRVVLRANARSGTAPRLEVRAGETVVVARDVPSGSFQEVSGTFTAAETAVTLVLAQTREGSDTVLLDDVRVLGATSEPLPPMDFAPVVSEVGPGQVMAHTLTIPVRALEGGPVEVRLASGNANVARLVGASVDGTLTLRFTPAMGGEAAVTQRTFEVEAVGRGSAAINVVEAAGIPLLFAPSVQVVMSLVKNASFESNVAGAFPGYGEILGWGAEGGTGLNRAGGPNDPAGPFGDNGVVPDREQVAFIQGNGRLHQEIVGLEPGQRYWLQFHYNARDCCGERSHGLTVRFAGEVLAEFPDLLPAAVLGEVDYFAAHLPFTAQASSGLLEFVHEVASGDASVVLDGVTIVARRADEMPVWNPSFEASGSPPGVGYLQPYRMAGWEGGSGGRGVNVDGAGPFTDNGASPDQDRAAFLQNVGSYLAQTVHGLTPGQRYTLVVAINARNCCSGVPTAAVSVDGEVLLEEEILPAGGRQPFRALYLPFTASASEGTIRFEVTGPAGGDVSLLLDDVHVVHGERTPPVVTLDPAGQEVAAGATLELSTAASGTDLRYQWRLNGVALIDGGRIAGARTATLRITGVMAADAGNYTVLVSDGLGTVGSEVAVVTVEAGSEPPMLRAVRVAGGVQLRWPVEAAGFALQRTGALGGGWTAVAETATQEGGDWVVTVSAEGAAGYFRLAQ